MIPAVAEFLPHSMIEWEDRLAALVLLQGCNCRCPFCHSAVFVPPGKPARPISWDSVKERLTEDRAWIDGVVVSGGEPTIHAGLVELLADLRQMEIPAKLDTNGSNPAVLKRLIDERLVEHVALDVKSPLDESSHDRATGTSGFLPRVRESLEILKTGGVSYELRTTVWPTVFPDGSSLVGLARELAWATRWFLQGFRPVGCLDPETTKLPETNPAWLAKMAEQCREIAPGCRVRGG
jgi:pyruvate formate lyase activating enzyme